MAGSKRVTIAEIAQRAGVSVSTVSYVLSRKRSISKEVRDQVLRTMQDLDYRPNQLARSFKESRTWTIALYTMTTTRMQDNGYFASVLAGMLDSLSPQGYTVRIFPDFSSMAPDEESRLRNLPAVDGSVIFHQGQDTLYRDYFTGLDHPYVFIGRPGVVSDAPYVTSDHYTIGYRGLRHLIQNEYQSFAHIDSPESERGSQDKATGIADALSEAELPLDTLSKFVVPDFTIDNGYAVAEEILQAFGGRPERLGILSASHVVSAGLLKALRARGIAVPRHVGVVSAGERFLNEIHREPLAALLMNPYRVGYESAELVVSLMDEPGIPAASRVVPVEFTPGASCAPP